MNGTFVPELNHSDVLNLFHDLKVDGHTRLDLVWTFYDII